MEATVKLKIHVNDTTFTATLEENSSAASFAEEMVSSGTVAKIRAEKDDLKMTVERYTPASPSLSGNRT